MQFKFRPAVQSFPLAALAVFIASVVRTLVHVFFDETIPYTPFYPAVIVGTMIGGWRAGLFATLLSGIAASYWLEPFGELLIVEPTDLVGMSLFLVVCAIVVWLSEQMRLAQQSAERAAEERQTLLLAEQEARAVAETINRLKDDFVTAVSHELRTPLQAILGWAEVLRLAPSDEVQAESAVEIIQRNARLQSQLIEDLLDISRISTGKMRLAIRPLKLADVIASAIETVDLAARAKCIRIDCAIDNTAVVLGDSDRLKQVVWNLLSNAIKFTPKDGRITVELRVDNGHAVITVTDSGVGIAREFVPFVFDRFRQFDTTTSRRHGGLGLGLSIAKNLVELHGGTISAESAGLSHGSSFTVCLPSADHSAFASLGSRQVLSKTESLEGLRVLVVDDDSDTCRLVKHILEERNAEVLTAHSADEALIDFDKWKPDLLISDLGMPGQDGYALIREVRRRGISKLPAVAFSAYTSDDDRKRTLASGFQLHLAKPIAPEEFASAVAEVVRRTPK